MRLDITPPAVVEVGAAVFIDPVVEEPVVNLPPTESPTDTGTSAKATNAGDWKTPVWKTVHRTIRIDNTDLLSFIMFLLTTINDDIAHLTLL